jgi:hypothetical protein
VLAQTTSGAANIKKIAVKILEKGDRIFFISEWFFKGFILDAA